MAIDSRVWATDEETLRSYDLDQELLAEDDDITASPRCDECGGTASHHHDDCTEAPDFGPHYLDPTLPSYYDDFAREDY